MITTTTRAATYLADASAADPPSSSRGSSSRCSDAAEELGANVWSVQPRTPWQRRADATPVVLDASNEYLVHHPCQIIRGVNGVRHDAIRVPERQIDGSGRVLSIGRARRGEHGPRVKGLDIRSRRNR